MPFNHVMVDIETTGTCPVHGAMIQLSAVRFDFETQELDMNMFDMCLAIPPNRFWAEDTREWWSKQPPHIINEIFGRMQDPRAVMHAFYHWVLRDLDGEAPILWAKPAHFEQPFLQSYFREYGPAMPFHYRVTEDLNSWCRARGMPDLDRDVEFEGDAHNALHDVLHQIKVLFTLLERTS